MISYKHKFVFIDIVKTAGTSINKLLAQYKGVGKHHSISRKLPSLRGINDHLHSPLDHALLDAFYKFTIVRNPYDRFVSLYAFTQECALQKNFKQNGWEGLLNIVAQKVPPKGHDRETYYPSDLETYIYQLIQYNEYYCDYTLEKYIPMIDWLKNSDGDVVIDYIGRYENLLVSINHVLNHLQLEQIQELPYVNVSKNKHKEYAKKELKNNTKLQQMLYQYYKEDFEYFSYSKELPF